MSKPSSKHAWIRRPEKMRRKLKRADEIIEVPGLGRAVRAGRQVELVSTRTGDEHQALLQHLAEQHEEVEREIQHHVYACRAALATSDPLQVLHRAYGEFLAGMMNRSGEHDVDFDGCIDARMIDYVQAVLVGTPPEEIVALSDERWLRLRGHVTSIFRLLQYLWPSTRTAQRSISGSGHESEEKFFTPLFLQWLSVRGTTYMAHVGEITAAMLAPHDQLLRSVFGVGARELTGAIEEMIRRLWRGASDAMESLESIYEQAHTDEFIDETDIAQPDLHRAAFLDRLDKLGRRKEFEVAANRIYGTGLL